jgi:hypothetical protein
MTAEVATIYKFKLWLNVAKVLERSYDDDTCLSLSENLRIGYVDSTGKGTHSHLCSISNDLALEEIPWMNLPTAVIASDSMCFLPGHDRDTITNRLATISKNSSMFEIANACATLWRNWNTMPLPLIVAAPGHRSPTPTYLCIVWGFWHIDGHLPCPALCPMLAHAVPDASAHRWPLFVEFRLFYFLFFLIVPLHMCSHVCSREWQYYSWNHFGQFANICIILGKRSGCVYI